MSFAIPNRTQTQVRIDEALLKKVKVIARNESRNMNSQIEYFIKKGVDQYEAEHGNINPEDE